MIPNIKSLTMAQRHGAIVGLSTSLLIVASYLFIVRDTQTDKIKDQIVRAAIASYGGRCICPFNKTTQGGNCGTQSLYVKAHALDNKPVCYREDISEAMVESFIRADLPYER
jgi:Na+/H+-translocating membrane pyrophosphatase